MAGVTISGLTKTYGASDLPAVHDLNLTIGDNRFVTLLGPSGCGKTTTLRLIAGYMAPDHGTIHVGARLLSSPDEVVPPENRGMGMVFQNYAVWPHKSVYENVVFGLKLRRVPKAQAHDLVASALSLVNLTGLESRMPNELSGGQQQRVALARSLVVEPEILLLDEPLSNLDAKLRERMRVELKQLQRRTGITFIYVTHDQAEALALSDEVAVIHTGRIQQFGSPSEVYTRPANRVVADFMGHVNFLPGTVVNAAGGKGSLLIAGAVPADIELPSGLSAGAAIEIAVRPEDVTLSPADESSPGAATVNDRTFLGNLNEYVVGLPGGETLRVQTHPRVGFDIGARVNVGFDPARISVFPRSTA
jgi:iron(III) transport system ATP-binding protein